MIECDNSFYRNNFLLSRFNPLLVPLPSAQRGVVRLLQHQDDIIGQTRECELLVVADKLLQVVALGKVYEEAIVPLSLDVAKVAIEKVRVPDARFHYLQMR